MAMPMHYLSQGVGKGHPQSKKGMDTAQDVLYLDIPTF